MLEQRKKIDTKVRLSTLWIVTMLNMVFADVFSILIEMVDGNTLDVPGDVKTVMAIAAVFTTIPILMIYLSRILAYKANRIVNVLAAAITIVYVVGGGDTAPHYIILASIEIISLSLIVLYSIRWKDPAKA